MPDETQIQAALDLLEADIAASKATRDSIALAVRKANVYTAVADAVAAEAGASIGAGGTKVRITDPAAVSKLVAYLRSEAQAIRDGIDLPPAPA